MDLDIGGDFSGSREPLLHKEYRLEIALATNSTPDTQLFGVQLLRAKGRSGWIRTYHNAPMMTYLRAGYKLLAFIKSLDKFDWEGERCFWGCVEWGFVVANDKGLMDGLADLI